MRTLVVYDSLHGNTKIIAQAIGEAIPGEVEVLHVGDADASGLAAYGLLIVGSPTHGANASDEIRTFLDQIQAPALKGVNVASFDTRFADTKIGYRLVRLFGFAAPKIAKALQDKGGTLVGPPGGFNVTGSEGPLQEGELERAAVWARGLVESKA